MIKRNILAFLILIAGFYVSAQSLNGEGLIENGVKNQNLDSWQTDIAKKEKKNIEDYYLLLPKKLLEIESEIKYDSKEYRLEKAHSEKNPNQGRVNLKSGYLIASPDAYLKMTLFKDKINNKDIIAIVLGCGMPPIQYCDFGFIEFDNEKMVWKINMEIFPWTKFNAKCKEIAKLNSANQEEFIPNIILPEFGTTIYLIDAWDSKETPLISIKWNGQSFEI